MKGVSYESRHSAEFSSPDSDATLREIVVPSGANWLAVVVTCYQETLQSTEIDCTSPDTATDDDVRHAVSDAHELGPSRWVKAVVGDDASDYRAYIRVAAE